AAILAVGPRGSGAGYGAACAAETPGASGRGAEERRAALVRTAQVISRPGCTSARVLNHLCFGRCSSFYIPSSDPTPVVFCNSCVPARKRWTSVTLWCGAGQLASPRRVRISTVLVQKCQCRPKL
ncbi:mCG66260, partial [Mus musculus]